MNGVAQTADEVDDVASRGLRGDDGSKVRRGPFKGALPAVVSTPGELPGVALKLEDPHRGGPAWQGGMRLWTRLRRTLDCVLGVLPGAGFTLTWLEERARRSSVKLYLPWKGQTKRKGAAVKPLDQVIRDRIAPVLKSAGFKESGRLFTLERPDGNRAHVNVHAFRLGMNDAEFFLNLHIQPKIWRDLQALDGSETYLGLWSTKLGPPNGKAGGIHELWRIDLDDEAAGAELSQTLAAVLPGFLGYLDVDILADYVRHPTDPISKVRGSSEAVVAALLAAHGPSPRLDAALAQLDEEGTQPGGLQPAEFAGFVRAWALEHSGAGAT